MPKSKAKAKSKPRKVETVPIREEYVPYPEGLRCMIGLSPHRKYIDWTINAIDFEIAAEHSLNYGLECSVLFYTYKKQPILRIVSGRYYDRIFIDKRYYVPSAQWETLH